MTTTTTTVLNSVLQANPYTWCWDWRNDNDDFNGDDDDDDGDDDDDDYGLETKLDANKLKTKIIWDQNRYEDD